MSSILDALLGSGNQGNIADLAKHFNLDEKDISAAIKNLLPALSGGLKQHLQEQPDSQVVQEAKTQGTAQYMDDADAKVYSEEAVSQGNNTLTHILGSQDNSNALADKVSSASGVSGDVIKKLLPMAATMLMGSVAKHADSQEGTASGTNILSVLTGFLDKNNDGSIKDDLINLAGKLFK